jgi:hypothetical protein
VSEAYTAYFTALQEPWQSGDLAQRVSALGTTYSQALRHALSGTETRAHLDVAFNRYIAATKAAWAAIDVTEVHPQDLVAIAQSMAWVASIAAEIRSDVAA